MGTRVAGGSGPGEKRTLLEVRGDRLSRTVLYWLVDMMRGCSPAFWLWGTNTFCALMCMMHIDSARAEMSRGRGHQLSHGTEAPGPLMPPQDPTSIPWTGMRPRMGGSCCSSQMHSHQ